MTKTLFVNKSIRIDASAKYIWQALTDQEISRQWVSEFGIKDGKIVSDWKESSEVSWLDSTGKTIVTGKVISVDPLHHLHFSVIDVNSGPMPDSTDADGLTYQITEANGRSTLIIKQGDFGKMSDGAKYHSASEKIWNKVLQKVKNVAEEMQKLAEMGYQQIHVCPLPPKDSGEHTHDVKTAHVILNGQLTIIDQGKINTYQPGDAIEFPANTTHQAHGTEDGQMIVAF